MRALEGYSKDEQKELKEAKDNGLLSAMTLIYGIVEGYGDCHALSEKYCREGPNRNNKMAKDIIDFYYGNAKFSEQMYKVTLPDGNCLVKDKIDGNRWKFTYSDRDGYDIVHSNENTFTRKEIENIDSRYMAFAVPVEDDDEI